MKKNLIIGTVVVVGMLSLGALSASAADTSAGFVIDKQSYQKFTQETAALTSALKAKESELNQANAYVVSEADRFAFPDIAKINALESQIKELKEKINAAAQKYGTPFVTAQSE